MSSLPRSGAAARRSVGRNDDPLGVHGLEGTHAEQQRGRHKAAGVGGERLPIHIDTAARLLDSCPNRSITLIAAVALAAVLALALTASRAACASSARAPTRG